MLSKIVFIGCTMLAAVSGTTSGFPGGAFSTGGTETEYLSTVDEARLVDTETKINALLTGPSSVASSVASVVASQIQSSDLMGAEGDRGDKGEKGSDEGIKGDRGDKGDKGDKGEKLRLRKRL